MKIEIPDELHERVADIAERLGVPTDAIVRNAIDTFIGLQMPAPTRHARPPQQPLPPPVEPLLQPSPRSSRRPDYEESENDGPWVARSKP